MNPLLAKNADQLHRLCEEYGVERLEIFGSATRADFELGTSDLDFLVSFHPLSPGKRADAYFGLLRELERLFDCPVDLVMVRAVRNPYFLEVIAPSRTTLYAA